jgi:small subunit ribosomal protein S9
MVKMEEAVKTEEKKIVEGVSMLAGVPSGAPAEETLDIDDLDEVIDVKKKVKAASKRAGMIVKAKKKTAVARGVIKKGTGKIKVNKMNLKAYAMGYVLEFISEPLKLAKDDFKDYDIVITVKGSGFMSQAVAIRACIAKAIVRAKGKKYKEIFNNFDRMLLVDDVRKVESKKPLGRKARKKWQHSKR